MKTFRAVVSFLISVLVILAAVAVPTAVKGSVSGQKNAQTVSGGGTLPTVEKPEEEASVFIDREEPVVLPDYSEETPLTEPATEEIPTAAAGNSELPAERTTAEGKAPASPRNAEVYEVSGITDMVSMLAFDREYVGSFASVDERHVYTFAADSRGVFQYGIGHGEISDFGGWTATLYQEYSTNGDDSDSVFRVLNVLNTSLESGTDRSVKIGVMPGNYRLIIEPAKTKISYEAYTLTANFTPGSEYEVECNDNIYRYTEIYSGVPLKGTTSYFTDHYDTDCFMVRLPKDGFLTLSFEHETLGSISVGWRVVLYDQNGNELYSENSSHATPAVNSGSIGLKAGCYFIGIYGRVYADCEYLLSVSRTASEWYESELNDSPETADPIDPNRSVSGSVSSKRGSLDRDYFALDVTEPSYLQFSFSHAADEEERKKATPDDPGKNGWNVRLRSSDGKDLYHIVSAWAAEYDESPFIGLSEGRYYLIVDSEDMYRNAATYTVSVDLTPAADWEREPNPDPDRATVLTAGIPVYGTLTEMDTDFDEDWFTFTLEERRSVGVVLAHTSDATGHELYQFTLYDADMNPVKLCNPDGTPMKNADGSYVTTCVGLGGSVMTNGYYYGLKAGKYTIRLTGGLYFDNMPYTLTVTTM